MINRSSWLVTMIVSCCLQAGAMLALGATTAAVAQQQDVTVRPANSHPVAYGGGWRCDYGYVARASQCEEVAPPVNGRLTARGDDWECARGFRRL
jgi:hypothetical protein